MLISFCCFSGSSISKQYITEHENQDDSFLLEVDPTFRHPLPSLETVVGRSNVKCSSLLHTHLCLLIVL